MCASTRLEGGKVRVSQPNECRSNSPRTTSSTENFRGGAIGQAPNKKRAPNKVDALNTSDENRHGIEGVLITCRNLPTTIISYSVAFVKPKFVGSTRFPAKIGGAGGWLISTEAGRKLCFPNTVSFNYIFLTQN